jgi:coenzyme F420 hydrogenase subunit beta
VTPKLPRLFKEVRPGVRLRSPNTVNRPLRHPSFGSYVSSWEAWASDEEIRFAGSSGGVLTALGEWLVRSGRIKAAITSAGSASAPTRTVPVRIISKEEFIASAGSRYAPVSNVQSVDDGGTDLAVVGKPCEFSALKSLQQSNRGGSGRGSGDAVLFAPERRASMQRADSPKPSALK